MLRHNSILYARRGRFIRLISLSNRLAGEARAGFIGLSTDDFELLRMRQHRTEYEETVARAVLDHERKDQRCNRRLVVLCNHYRNA